MISSYKAHIVYNLCLVRKKRIKRTGGFLFLLYLDMKEIHILRNLLLNGNFGSLSGLQQGCEQPYK